jgi:GntR family transcriptional regulator
MDSVKLNNTRLPRHYQIADYIELMLSRGEIDLTEPLLPEERLKDIFSVSRTTIRRAIEHLRENGLIERERGRGTFWTAKAGSLKEEKKSGVNRQIFGINDSTRVRKVEKSSENAGAEASDFLGLKESDTVTVFRRVRYSGERPMSYTVNYLLPVYGQKITSPHLEKMTMLETLEQVCGVKLGTIEHQVEIFRATPEIAEKLKVQALDPTLCVNTRVFDTEGSPVEIVWTWFAEDMYRFRVVL